MAVQGTVGAQPQASPEQKRRPQDAYFPDGLAWTIVRYEWDQPGEWGMEFRTRLTPSMFEDIRGIMWPEDRVASPTGADSNPVVAWLRGMDSLRQAIGAAA
jgi:hypothetical protein